MNINSSDFTSAIEKLLAEQVQKICDEEAAAASKRVGERIRETAANIATRVLTWHRMEVRGSELVITINIPPEFQRNG